MKKVIFVGCVKNIQDETGDDDFSKKGECTKKRGWLHLSSIPKMFLYRRRKSNPPKTTSIKAVAPSPMNNVSGPVGGSVGCGELAIVVGVAVLSGGGVGVAVLPGGGVGVAVLPGGGVEVGVGVSVNAIVTVGVGGSVGGGVPVGTSVGVGVVDGTVVGVADGTLVGVGDAEGEIVGEGDTVGEGDGDGDGWEHAATAG
jgi:hypothetical protein